MKAKINILIVLTLMALLNPLYGEKVQVTVLDEKGEPLKGATVDIWHLDFRAKNDKKITGATDQQGQFTGRGNAQHSISVVVTKNGWYESELERLKKNQDHDLTVVMRIIEKPIPLYVRRVLLKAPVFDKWLGFDFELGDWVAPQGKGKSRDILFRFQREFKGYRFSEEKLEKMKFPDTTEEDLKKFYGKWDGVLQIGFPSELAGIIEENQGYRRYSEMKMPHLAPDEGYQSEEIVIKKKSHRSEEESLKELQDYAKNGVPESKPKGFFIRTRVVEVNGKIIKANYVKLQMRDEDEDRGEKSPLRVGASGTVSFTYYFNSTANDRNLEFNSKANLATEQTRFYAP